jgi:hypothetical protein
MQPVILTSLKRFINFEGEADEVRSVAFSFMKQALLRREIPEMRHALQTLETVDVGKSVKEALDLFEL